MVLSKIVSYRCAISLSAKISGFQPLETRAALVWRSIRLGRESMKTLDEFVKENCMMCGTQRCNPYDFEWLEGCLLYQQEKDNIQLPEDIELV